MKNEELRREKREIEGVFTFGAERWEEDEFEFEVEGLGWDGFGFACFCGCLRACFSDLVPLTYFISSGFLVLDFGSSRNNKLIIIILFGRSFLSCFWISSFNFTSGSSKDSVLLKIILNDDGFEDEILCGLLNGLISSN